MSRTHRAGTTPGDRRERARPAARRPRRRRGAADEGHGARGDVLGARRPRRARRRGRARPLRGSGALAIEALSRGAARARVVERDAPRRRRGAGRTSRRSDCGDRARVAASTSTASSPDRPRRGAVRPGVRGPALRHDRRRRWPTCLAALAGDGWLAADAIVSVERPIRHPVAAAAGVGGPAGSGHSAIRC